MKIALIHGPFRQGAISMALYAASIQKHLAQSYNVIADDISLLCPPRTCSANPYMAKLVGYYEDFRVYPKSLAAYTHYQQPDIYHITDHIYSYLLNKLPASRTVITCHDLIPLLRYARMMGELQKMSTLGYWHFKHRIKSLGRAACVIVPSKKTKEDLIAFQLCDASKIKVVYPGINYPYAPCDATKRLKIREELGLENKFILLHVGSSAFYKNVEGIIQAVRLLVASGGEANQFVFLKAGQPFTTQQQKLIEQFGIAKYVRYVGDPSDYQELCKLYNAADAFVFPSLYEGFGWPPIEAMACGLPVICSHSGALGEVVQDAALICDPYDPASLATQVQRLCRDSLLGKSMQEKGFSQARKFQWETAINQIMSIYQQVISERAVWL